MPRSERYGEATTCRFSDPTLRTAPEPSREVYATASAQTGSLGGAVGRALLSWGSHTLARRRDWSVAEGVARRSVGRDLSAPKRGIRPAVMDLLAELSPPAT